MKQILEQPKILTDTESERYHLLHDALLAMSNALGKSLVFDVPARFRFCLMMSVVDLRVRQSVHLGVLQWAVSVIRGLPLEPIEIDRLLRFHCLDEIARFPPVIIKQGFEINGDSAT